MKEERSRRFPKEAAALVVGNLTGGGRSGLASVLGDEERSGVDGRDDNAHHRIARTVRPQIRNSLLASHCFRR